MVRSKGLARHAFFQSLGLASLEGKTAAFGPKSTSHVIQPSWIYWKSTAEVPPGWMGFGAMDYGDNMSFRWMLDSGRLTYFDLGKGAKITFYLLPFFPKGKIEFYGSDTHPLSTEFFDDDLWDRDFCNELVLHVPGHGRGLREIRWIAKPDLFRENLESPVRRCSLCALNKPWKQREAIQYNDDPGPVPWTKRSISFMSRKLRALLSNPFFATHGMLRTSWILLKPATIPSQGCVQRNFWNTGCFPPAIWDGVLHRRLDCQ